MARWSLKQAKPKPLRSDSATGLGSDLGENGLDSAVFEKSRGLGGDEIMHYVLDVMYADAPYAVIQRAVHIHTTITELTPTMLGSLAPLDGRAR